MKTYTEASSHHQTLFLGLTGTPSISAAKHLNIIRENHIKAALPGTSQRCLQYQLPLIKTVCNHKNEQLCHLLI